MTVQPFNNGWGDAFLSLYGDLGQPVPLRGPQLRLIPLDYVPAPPGQPVAFPTFNDLRDNPDYVTFDQLAGQDEFPTFDSIMRGHPGFPGGPPLLPAGSGLDLGFSHLGVEWWIVDAEGVEDSPDWGAVNVRPAFGDGSWPTPVTAPGRSIIINCTLVADHESDMPAAKDHAAAALAVSPHRGWLHYLDRRLPVQMAGQVRIRSRGARAADLQVNLLGVDIGTAGRGVHWESAGGDVTFHPTWGLVEFFELDGTIPSPPIITVSGVVGGAEISVGGVTVLILSTVGADEVLVIDSRRRIVTLNGALALDAVTFGAWPMLSAGVNRVHVRRAAGDMLNGSVRISGTPLF